MGPTPPGPTALQTQNLMVSSIYCLYILKFAIFYFLTSIVRIHYEVVWHTSLNTASLPFSTEDNLSLALTTTLVLVLVGITAVFALIVQPHFCKKIRQRRRNVQGCPNSGNTGAVEQREGSSEHEYDVIHLPAIRLPTIPEDRTSEGVAVDLPAEDSDKYSGTYASPYEHVNFSTVGEYAMLYATADTWNNSKEVGGEHDTGTDEPDKRSVPPDMTAAHEAKETTSMDELVQSATDSRDSAIEKDIEAQQTTAAEEHNA